MTFERSCSIIESYFCVGGKSYRQGPYLVNGLVKTTEDPDPGECAACFRNLAKVLKTRIGL